MLFHLETSQSFVEDPELSQKGCQEIALIGIFG